MAVAGKDGTAVPLIQMLSIQERENVELEMFFQFYKKHFNLSPDCIMTDCAANYALKISKHLPNVKHLLCTWHVYRAWKNQVRKHFSEDWGKRFAQLIEIQKILNKEKMIESLNSFLSNSPHQFKSYFETQYLKSIFKWAAFNRKGSGVNVNMAIESYHWILKRDFLECK